MQKRYTIWLYSILFVFQFWNTSFFFVIAQDTSATQEVVAEETSTEPTNTEPAEAKSNDAEPAKAEPTEVEPTEAEPTVEEPTVEEPIEEAPTEEIPTEEIPTEEIPIESQPTEVEPTEYDLSLSKPPKNNSSNNQPTITLYDTEEWEEIRIDEWDTTQYMVWTWKNLSSQNLSWKNINISVDKNVLSMWTWIQLASWTLLDNGDLQKNKNDSFVLADSLYIESDESYLFDQWMITYIKQETTSKEKSIQWKRRNNTKKDKASWYFQKDTRIQSMIKWSVNRNDLAIRISEKHKWSFGENRLWWIALGADDDHLVFSKPVQLDIPVHPEFNNQEVQIFVEHLWDTFINASWLTTNPEAVCTSSWTIEWQWKDDNIVTVIDGIATIYTCWASTFTVTYTWWATPENFVDNATLDKTITVGAGWLITDLLVIIDFHSIDGTNSAAPWGGDSYASENSFVLTSPTWTIVNLVNAGTYTDGVASQVTVTFDDAAWTAVGWGLPRAGTFSPVGTLSDFDNEDPVWDWILTMWDTTNDDGITLYSVSLQITDNVVCGDSTIDGAEGCDDGWTTPGDGCNANCLVEDTFACNTWPWGATFDLWCTSWVCDQTEVTPTCETANTCGNGTIEGIEECDDGNTSDGDGCSSICEVEYCGNSIINSGATLSTIFSEDFESDNWTTQTSSTTLISTPTHTLTYENSWANGQVRYGTNAIQNNGWAWAATLDVTPTGTFVTNYLIFETDASGLSWADDIELTFDWSDHQDEDQAEDIVEIRWSNTDTWITVYDRKANDIWDGVYQSVTIDIDDVLTTNNQNLSTTFQIRFGQNDNFTANNTTTNDWLSIDNVELSWTIPWPLVTEACDDGNTSSGDGCSSTCEVESWYTCTWEPSICSVCGDWILDTWETCDDGNTSDSDGCSSTCQIETDRECSGTPSTCIQCNTEKIIVGYNVTNVDDTVQSINYSTFTNNTYSSPPIVLATPQTDNSTNNYPIPVIRNITTGWFDISICLDAWDATCASSPPTEDISIFVVDTDRSACTDHIEAWTIDVATNWSDTAFTFTNAFTNLPYVFTTPQTSNQWWNIAAHAWVDDGSLSVNWWDFVGCVHQAWNLPDFDNCTAGQPNETLWWVALDPSLFTMSWAQSWTQNIWNSTWTNVTFSPTYSTTPAVMVTQNSDNWGQDPQYARARDVTTAAADIRYCEADAWWVCNSHTNEIVRWLSVDIALCGNGVLDTWEECDDANTTNGDGCSDICELQAVCGDGIIETWEECDDSNNSNGDGCSSLCLLENPGNCGNGIINAWEVCDDNNTTTGDGCNQFCQVEAGYVCPDLNNCGNGVIDAWEQCDDWWTVDWDWCSQYCIEEFNFLLTTFTGESLIRTPAQGWWLWEPIWSFGGGWYEASVSTASNPFAHVLYSPFNFRSLAAPRAVELALQWADDDDFIWYVFGWQPGDRDNPDADFILINRKDTDQTFDFDDDPIAWWQADQWLSIVRVQGQVSYDELWQHIDSPNTTWSVTELARWTTYWNLWYTPDLYDTSVFYNTWQIDVYVNGALDISLTWNFEDGRFWIYILAQQWNTFALGKPHPYALWWWCYAECGDWVIVADETCDDGNTINGDGCSEFCSIEAVDECALSLDNCNSLEVCYDSYEWRDCVCEIDDCSWGIVWDVCLTSPTSFTFSGNITSEYTDTTFEQQFAESFQIDDSSWNDSWYYTTLQISDFTWLTYGDTISNTNLERYSTWMSLLSGDTNADVILATWWSSYRTADSIYTFILRDPGANSGRTWIYATFPRLRFNLPAYTRPDTYQAEITYTLYEN